ncbi:MAG: cell division protein ZapA, partial [Lachnospiraceae bacterium]|nr:cell division protein ZapA [Lachnospiraceae bacterium]
MSDINETQVIIAGKVLTLTGYETAEYTQKVANYINKKLDECKATASFRSQNKETQMLLVALNIADDYMKIHERNAEVETLIKDKDKEIYNLKHDIVTTQSRLDKADEQVRTLQDKMAESSKKLIQLDAKLRSKEKEAKAETKTSSKKSAAGAEKDNDAVKPADDRKDETVTKPAEDKKTGSASKPAEDKKPESAVKPTEDKKPESTVKPAEDKKPESAVK